MSKACLFKLLRPLTTDLKLNMTVPYLELILQWNEVDSVTLSSGFYWELIIIIIIINATCN